MSLTNSANVSDYPLERSLKKLTKGLPLYRDKLHKQDIFAHFAEILCKAQSNKSVNKLDTKLNEL